MCKKLSFLVTICSLLITLLAPLPAQATEIQEGIDHILNRFAGNYNVGIMVKSLGTGQTLYQHNAEQNLMPASTLKLFTGVAALDFLGPNYTFTTQFLTDASDAQNGVLHGNLYVKFSGDPNLTTDVLNRMVNALVAQGIHTIQGNIYVDDTAIDRTTWQTGRIPKDKIFCYAAPATATIINRNCFSFNVTPNRKANAPASVKVNQKIGNVLIENQVVTRRGRGGCSLNLKPVADNHYVLTGCLAPRRGPISIAVALQNPNLAIGDILANLFKGHNINYHQVEFGKTPAHARVLTQNTSPPLAALLTHMLKKSDNLIADSFLKKLGETYYSTQGSWQTGIQAEAAILAPKTGIDFQRIMILDGSGLSRDSMVNADDFVKLLSFAYMKMPYRDVFYHALPRSGLDGTLRRRLGGSTADRIHAKTGTMKGISGLAGYIQTANNQMLAFAILVNTAEPGTNNQARYHLLVDRICEFLANSHVTG